MTLGRSVVLDHPTWQNRLLEYHIYDGNPEEQGTELLRTVSYTYYKTGQASNITVWDEGAGPEYGWAYDLALYYHSHGPLWRALWGKYELDEEQKPTGYVTSWAREFHYDTPRARHLAVDYDTDESSDPVDWMFASAPRTHYTGDLIGLNEAQVELHQLVDTRVGRQQPETLTGLALRDPHRAELVRHFQVHITPSLNYHAPLFARVLGLLRMRINSRHTQAARDSTTKPHALQPQSVVLSFRSAVCLHSQVPHEQEFSNVPTLVLSAIVGHRRRIAYRL